jgi:predicted permease
MRAVRKLRLLVRSLVASSRVEAELDEELRYHLDRQIDLYRAEGMSYEDARFRALREFGGVDQRKEECRDARGLGLVETVAQDVRYAWRTLRRTPGFALLGILVMALGIGANTAIFTLLDQVLLRPLPVAHPDELVRLRWDGEFNGLVMSDDSHSYPFFRDIREHASVFSGVMCRFRVPLSVGRRDRTELVDGELVSGNYFDVLGVGPAVGRTFTDADNRVPGGHPLAVLSYDYWVTRFDADPGVVGQPLTIAGLPFTIVGVSQRGFDGVELGYSPKIRVPIAMKVQLTQGFFAEFFNLENRRAFWMQVFARLKPGVGREQAQASLQPLFKSILRQEMSAPGFENASARVKADFLRSTLALDPGGQGRSSLREDYDMPLRVLMAMVALMLLLACANLANLILERALARRKEIAVRLALGARPAHIVRQVLAESLLVSLAGAAAGVALATIIGEWLVAFVPNESVSSGAALAFDGSPNLRVLGFTLAVSVATGLLFGIAPALAARRTNLTSAMGREGRGVTGPHVRLRQAL